MGACDIGSPLARAACLNSFDGVEVGTAQWVLNGVKAVGPRVRNLPKKVNLAGLMGRSSNLQDDACDLSEGTLPHALCMDTYDPLSIASAGWVQNGIKKARSKLPKVKLGSLRRAQDVNPHDEIDACETSDEALAQALCLQNLDPFSNGSTSWVLNFWGNNDDGWVGTTRNQSEKSERAGGLFGKLWRSPSTNAPAARRAVV